MKQFRDLPYSINESGQVWSHRTKKFLKPRDNGQGFWFVTLNQKHFYIRKMVIECFGEDLLPKRPHKQIIKKPIDLDKRRRKCRESALRLKTQFPKKHDQRLLSIREFHLNQKYGINNDEYANMLIKQNYRCKICQIDERISGNKHFAVDHCHITGRIRGLLCNSCNIGIGNLRDSPDIVRRALVYLENGIEYPCIKRAERPTTSEH